MPRKNDMSSWGVVSTERDGGSILWAVKGTLVSTVIVALESEEMWRTEGIAAAVT